MSIPEDDVLSEVREFVLKIAPAIAYYKVTRDNMPPLEWGITHHAGGWSVHMRFGRLQLLSGCDMNTSEQALEFMEHLADAVNEALLVYYGVAIAPYSPDISMN